MDELVGSVHYQKLSKDYVEKKRMIHATKESPHEKIILTKNEIEMRNNHKKSTKMISDIMKDECVNEAQSEKQPDFINTIFVGREEDLVPLWVAD